MSYLIKPTGYKSLLNLSQTELGIKAIKDFFQQNLSSELRLRRVTAPLFVLKGMGINDDLNGVERAVTFPIKDLGDAKAEIVHSLAKWKRLTLADYQIEEGYGIYTDMNAIRSDEELDNLHSLYVDQWDWERVMKPEERTVDFLKEIVERIYAAMVRTEYLVYEMFPAKSNLSRTEVLSLLDYDTFYAMRRKGVPVEVDLVFEESVRCGIIIDNCDTTYDISNFGALLYAKDLDSFPTLSGKAVRIITYIGDSKISAKQEYRSRGGYIVDFNRMIAEILSNTISRETLNDDGIRRIEYQYPEVTLRELLANMLVHQDLYKKTMSPMVEIFTSRIEFTNLGKPLVPIKRIVDYPPQTRNENLAKEFYRTGICERRGSGWDKIADEANRYKFPAPTITTTNDTTNVTLSPHRVLADMTYAERMWSIYIYTCLLWSNKKYLTNALVRELFDIPESSKSMASLLINQAQKEKLITVFDENVGVRSRKYMPAYAKRESKNG